MAKEDFQVTGPVRQFCTVMRPEESEPPLLVPELREVVGQWLSEIWAGDELAAVGLTPRRSALLGGPPGCGKTTLAHHLAARLGLPLLVVNSDMLLSTYMSGSANNIGALFTSLQGQEDRCLLLFDEFDAIAARRATTSGSGSERDTNSTVSALLVRLEAFPGVIMAATNRTDDIDPAMWRRFGLHLDIGLPGNVERFAILKRYLLPMVLPDAAVDVLVAATAGAAPSLLRQLAEGIKRDLILSPKQGRAVDAAAVFRRLVVSVKPHTDYGGIPLWDDATVRKGVCAIAWPPVLPPPADLGGGGAGDQPG